MPNQDDADILYDLTDRNVHVPPEVWVQAWYLGGARSKLNSCYRESYDDRSESQHKLSDFMGAAAELLIYRLLKSNGLSAEGCRYIRENIFNPKLNNGGHDVDLVLAGRGYDIKSFDCSPNKRYFAVSKKTHDNLRGHCDGYLCVMFPPRSKQALIMNVHKYRWVDDFEEKDFGNPHRMALVANIDDFCISNRGDTWRPGRDSRNLYPRGWINELINIQDNRQSFIRQYPSLMGWV